MDGKTKKMTEKNTITVGWERFNASVYTAPALNVSVYEVQPCTLDVTVYPAKGDTYIL